MQRAEERAVTLSVALWGPRPPAIPASVCGVCGESITADENRVDVDTVEHRTFHEACFEWHLDGLVAYRSERASATGPGPVH